MEAARAQLAGTPPDMANALAAASQPQLSAVPSPDEKGFFYEDSPNIFGRVSRTIAHVANIAINQPHLNSPAMPEGVVVTDGRGAVKISTRFLVTEPRPETGIDPKTASNDVLHPGLSEFGDFGSALRLHVAHAERHPERRVITNPTAGVSHGGKLLSGRELMGRCPEKTARFNLRLLRHVTQDGPIRLMGVSLGSYIATHMAEQNVGADEAKQLNIEGLALIASAVVALHVDDHENFRDPDIDEHQHRAYLTKSFLMHIPWDLARMTRKHPLDTSACVPIIAAYASAPHKLRPRLQAIHADFKSVQNGAEWSMLKHIAPELTIGILGGEFDPLIVEQIPQWDALGSLYPGQVTQRILPDFGHLMTIDARRSAAELDKI
ncbi:MAG TPA: alpha/beta hydrolase [Candidatus Saccharimonadales bacterium]|nr:alpha/beta hydrolase [Candidatus Saccharimonadales bacterium]